MHHEIYVCTSSHHSLGCYQPAPRVPAHVKGYTSGYTLDVRTLFLPTARGYGNLPDLHIAMSLDNEAGGLLDQVATFATSRSFGELFTDVAGVRADVRGILMSWAGVDEAAVATHEDHGVFAEMPEFLFLRQLSGIESDYTGTWFDGGKAANDNGAALMRAA